MSMISEQVNELREIAKSWNPNVPINPVSVVLNKAADTIESLSTKLQAANMERSADCGGWILCKEQLPCNYQDVLVSGDGIVKQAQFINNVFECEDPDFYAMLDDEKVIGCEDTTFKALAWKPLPEPYHEP